MVKCGKVTVTSPYVEYFPDTRCGGKFKDASGKTELGEGSGGEFGASVRLPGVLVITSQ